MKYMLIFAICAVLSEWSLGATALEDCRYKAVQRHYQDCVYAGFNDTGLVRNLELDYLRDMCRRDKSIRSCLVTYAEGCSNGDAIVKEERRFTGWCNDSKVADWVIEEFTPLFEDFEMKCLYPLRSDLTNCATNMSWVMDEGFNPTLEDGMSRLRSGLAEWMACVKAALKEKGIKCNSLTWQAVYNILVYYMNSGSLGMNVGRSDLIDIERDDIERQLKRAKLPFSWLQRTNF